MHFFRKKCIKKPPLLGREDCLPPSHLGGEIFDSLCRRGQVSSPLASLGFRGANPRRLYRRRSLAYFVGSAGFPARHACRFGVLSASIYIPRLRVAAPSTRSRWRVTFRLRGGGFSAQPARGFGVIAHRLRSRGTSQPRRVRFPSPFVSLL